MVYKIIDHDSDVACSTKERKFRKIWEIEAKFRKPNSRELLNASIESFSTKFTTHSMASLQKPQKLQSYQFLVAHELRSETTL